MHKAHLLLFVVSCGAVVSAVGKLLKILHKSISMGIGCKPLLAPNVQVASLVCARTMVHIANTLLELSLELMQYCEACVKSITVLM